VPAVPRLSCYVIHVAAVIPFCSLNSTLYCVRLAVNARRLPACFGALTISCAATRVFSTRDSTLGVHPSPVLVDVVDGWIRSAAPALWVATLPTTGVTHTSNTLHAHHVSGYAASGTDRSKMTLSGQDMVLSGTSHLYYLAAPSRRHLHFLPAYAGALYPFQTWLRSNCKRTLFHFLVHPCCGFLPPASQTHRLSHPVAYAHTRLTLTTPR